MSDAGGTFDRERLGDLFERALSLPPAARNAFVDDACASEPELRRELQSLLDAHTKAPNRLERMADEVVTAALRAVSAAMYPVGRTISHYRIEEVIGGGGMGVVYRARDLALGRPVALKFLNPHLTCDAGARMRLESEARAASALDHPNIAVVYEIGDEPPSGDGGEAALFIAMAYYAGETIRQKISRGPLPIGDGLRYATQIADGLARAHESGIVHRDIKPANVIVTDRDEVRIIDFGIARSAGSERTRPGATPGTVAYMSPEHTRGEPVDGRTDIWSLGAMLHEMLTGRRPFRGDNDAVLIHAIRHDDPEPLRRLRPEVPVALARVVETCLAKDPGARYQQTGELVTALQAVEGITEQTPPARGRIPVSRRAAAVGSLLVLALVAGAALLVSPDMRTQLPQGRGDTPAVVDADPPTISVLPFAPTTADPALERIGRDLAVTLAAGLDGIGALQTVDASTTLDWQPSQGAPSLDDAHKLARGLSADRFVHGVLIRAGADIRLDFSLFETGSAEAIVRTSATAADLPSLTDAAIIALLDELWQRDPPHVPSLAAVKRSRVPAARRAYLEGELALTRLDMAVALDAFERAFAEDSTFWWAYWRSLYPRSYREASVPADPALLQQVVEHRWELPLQDRLLVEAWTTDSRMERLAQLQDLTDRFPDYSPAWWSYANLLVHSGGYLGRTAEDARWALERFLALKPRFVAGWNHLGAVALLQGDSATAARAASEEARWMADGARRRYWIPVQALRADVSRTRTIPPAGLSQAVDLVLSSPADLAKSLLSGMVADGSPVAQIQLNRAVRERGALPTLDVSLWRGDALAWAARGAWDDAMTAADRWARAAGDAAGALGAYRLAIAGVMAGGIPMRDASSRRPPFERALSPWSADEEADLLWLDGLLAYLAADANGIRSARRAIQGGNATHGVRLERSLAALAADAAGDRERASRAIVELETEIADRGPLADIVANHPLLVIANRLLAARWLRSLGNDAGAARLLTWHESMSNGAVTAAWNTAIGGVSLLDRAEIAEAGGDRARARRHFARFLERYDLAVPSIRPLVSRATAGLERLRSPGANLGIPPPAASR
jgi:serine/threonine-protein kinase